MAEEAKMMNKLQFEKNNDQLIVYFSGEIDSMNTINYRNLLVGEIETGKYRIVVMDFSRVSFIDSSGIGLVLGRYNQIKGLGGTLYITGLSAVAYRLFELTGIFKLMDYIKNMDEILVKVGEHNESDENNV